VPGKLGIKSMDYTFRESMMQCLSDFLQYSYTCSRPGVPNIGFFFRLIIIKKVKVSRYTPWRRMGGEEV
jgi:hypothetical protein